MRGAVCLLLGLALAPSASARQDLTPRYEREGGDWYRIERTGRFRVDPRVVSVRFASTVRDLADLRASAPDPSGILARLRPLRVNRLGTHDLHVPAGTDVLAARDALRASGRIEFAEENTLGEWVVEPDDTEFGEQWALKNVGQSGGVFDADIDADLAWDLTVGDPSVVITILDASVNVHHPDLSPNVWWNPGEVPGNGIDDDANGFVDDVHGWNFATGSADVTGLGYHGSFVTGVVCARTNDALGVAGVAGGFGTREGCRAMACPIGDFAPNSSVVDDALLYAADNGARVVTMAFTIGSSSAIDAAIEYARNVKGVFLDCAAGNNGALVGYPARDPRVVAVGASDRRDQHASFSNTGPQLWVAAPGVDIRSTGVQGWRWGSGTSFAAPHVAGIIGLVLADAGPLMISVDGLTNVLRVSATDLGTPGFDSETGWGRVDAYAALMHVRAGDCNANGVYDFDDIASGTSLDLDGDGVPDECACAPPVSYCVGAPNSAGPGATLWMTGTPSVSANDLVLHATGVPPLEPGLFSYAAGMAQLPLYEGVLCLALPVYRLPTVVADGAGTVTYGLDVSAPPQPAAAILPGSTWSFQLVYRDTAGGGSRGNLSDGLEIRFCP